MRYVIHSPESAFGGQVAGVAFANGRAEVDGDAHGRALAYFRRKGYRVVSTEPAKKADEPTGPLKPSKSAGKEELVTYAVDVLGMPEDEAKAKTRVELLDLIHKQEQETEQ